jgi:hypothetical protein
MPAKQVLYFHGFGESPEIATIATEALNEAIKGAGAELLALPAGFVKLETAESMQPIVDETYRNMCIDGKLESRAWYPLVKGLDGGHRAPPAKDFDFRATAEQQAAAVKAALKLIEDAGGVDGIIGFSQGGELCYLIAEARASLSAAAAKRLRFVATFGAEDTFLQRGQPPTSIPGEIHFFICFGDGDADAVVDSVTAAAALKGAGATKVVTRMVAELGHHMPKDTAIFAEMMKAFDTATAPEKAPPAPFVMPPKPAGWGSAHKRPFDPNRKPIVPLDQITAAFQTLRTGEDQARRDAMAEITNWSMCNDICSDFHEVEGAIDLLKELATPPDPTGVFTSVPGILAKMGFKEYDRNLVDPLIPPHLLNVPTAPALSAGA